MLKNPWHAINDHKNSPGDISYSLQIIGDLDHLCPPTFPRNLKEIFRQSEQIFQSKGMREQELAAQIIIAYLSLHTGEEKNAIKISKQAISESSQLPAQFLAKAIYIMSSAYSRIGNLDQAFRMVCENGILVAQSSRHELPWLPAQMQWLKAQILWKMYLYQNHSDLWCGPPIETGLNESRQIFPKAREILCEIDMARNLLPQGMDWPFNEILALALKGIDEDQGAVQCSAATLEDMANSYGDENPAVSGWALLAATIVHFKSGMHEKALSLCVRAGRIAQRFDLETLLRNALVYECRLREMQSDYPGALAAQKNLSVLHLRSVSGNAIALNSPKPQDSSQEAMPTAPLHLQNAIKYIHSNIRKKILIDDLAIHCRISRRALEISFKKYKQLTIFEYIKKKRMHLATDALLKQEMPMHRLARELGYSSQAVFSRDFSRHHGLSPRNWLRHQQNPDPYHHTDQ